MSKLQGGVLPCYKLRGCLNLSVGQPLVLNAPQLDLLPEFGGVFSGLDHGVECCY